MNIETAKQEAFDLVKKHAASFIMQHRLSAWSHDDHSRFIVDLIGEILSLDTGEEDLRDGVGGMTGVRLFYGLACQGLNRNHSQFRQWLIKEELLSKVAAAPENYAERILREMEEASKTKPENKTEEPAVPKKAEK